MPHRLVEGPEALVAALAAAGCILPDDPDGPTPNYAVIDLLTGTCDAPRRVTIHCGGGVPTFWQFWTVCDLCYGMTYRIVKSGTRCMYLNPTDVGALKPGSCCFTQARLRHNQYLQPPGLMWTSLPHYPSCWDYTHHDDPACLREHDVHCCAETHGVDTLPSGEFGPWDVETRKGPTKRSCEAFTVDGVWVENRHCQEDDYEGGLRCPTICDITPWGCCVCGYECQELPIADCVNKDGEFIRGTRCAHGSCGSNQRDCVVGFWRPALRAPEHAPKPDFQGLVPRARAGLFELVSFVNPTDLPEGAGNCRYHYARPVKRADGKFEVRMCGTTNVTPDDPPNIWSEPGKTHRSFAGSPMKLPGSVKHVVPIKYRPRCVH